MGCLGGFCDSSSFWTAVDELRVFWKVTDGEAWGLVKQWRRTWERRSLTAAILIALLCLLLSHGENTRRRLWVSCFSGFKQVQ